MKNKEDSSENEKTTKNEEIKEKVKEKKKTEEEEKDIKEPDLPTLFIWFISMLSGKSWEYLGLIMNPETKKINQDFKKAKISIDTIAYLFDQIKETINKEDFNRIENLLANLRMNYIQKLKESKD